MRSVRRWVLVVVVVLVALVALDRVALWVTQGVAERRVASEADASGVGVAVHGFPFLTQLAARDLHDVSLRADTASMGGIDVSDVRVAARGVSLRAPYVVESGTADAVVSVASLQTLLAERAPVAVDLAATKDGLQASVSLLGLPLAITLAPKVSGDDVTVDVVSASAGGRVLSVSSLPSVVRGWLADIRIPLDLPSGVRLTGVEVVPAGSGAVAGGQGGLRLVATGTDVPLADLASS